MDKRIFKFTEGTDKENKPILTLTDQFKKVCYGIIKKDHWTDANELRDVLAIAYKHGLDGLEEKAFNISAPIQFQENLEIFKNAISKAHRIGLVDKANNELTPKQGQ